MDTDHRFKIQNTCVCKGFYFDAGLHVYKSNNRFY